MKYLDEYRDADAAKSLAKAIAAAVKQPPAPPKSMAIMEVCGGQTHAIIRYGVDELLPGAIDLVHGPGCPVCVTPAELIDRAVAIAGMPGVIFCSFGDMLRVPGTGRDLLSVKAAGGDVRVVYSPLDALEIARSNPGKRVVFFAVGFETTAPANALAVVRARSEGVKNFSLLVSQFLIPPAMEAVLSSPGNRVRGFLAPGHVCAVTGYAILEPLAAKYRVPIVVTGFEPVDILQGILMCAGQLQAGKAVVENQYSRVVHREGNTGALKVMAETFAVCDRKWRGIGTIPASGLKLREEFRAHDAEFIFNVESVVAEEPAECISGLILTGIKKPSECPAFGVRCTPERPLGATMVSSEGACAAYYRYRRPGSARG